MSPAVLYTSYGEYSREQTGDIITFAQFEEGNLLSETQNLLSGTRDDMESGNKSDDDSTMPPIIIEEEMDTMNSGYEYYYTPISVDMLEDIYDSSHSHMSVNRREGRYKICNHIKRIQAEWKIALLYMQNMDKGLHKVFKSVAN